MDFIEHTPNEYLTSVAPIQRAEHVLRATLPTEEFAGLLDMPQSEPCLLLLRRTWSSDKIASIANLYYPRSRYEFAGAATM